jgi:ketosteroid isomerase-like protein
MIQRCLILSAIFAIPTVQSAVLPTVLQATLPAQQTTANEVDANAVKETLVAMWDAIEREDMEGYSSFIHPEFTAFGEGDVYLAEGKDLEVRSITDWVSRVEGVHTEMHQPEVTIHGDVAWITYYWSDSGYRNDGTRYTSRGKSTRIFVRENGRWLCIHGHHTEVV